MALLGGGHLHEGGGRGGPGGGRLAVVGRFTLVLLTDPPSCRQAREAEDGRGLGDGSASVSYSGVRLYRIFY